MSARSFGSLIMVASCAGAALGCYLVSLRVASERAALEEVETKIVLAQRDMRIIQTEIGTRGRLSQLERWNAGAFSLSAPAASQFLEGSFQLAQMVQPQHKVDFQAPVVLASAPAPEKVRPLDQAASESVASPASASPGGMLHQASLKTETREVPASTAATSSPKAVTRSTDKPVTAAKPAQSKTVDKPGLAAAQPGTKKSSPAPATAAAKTPGKKIVDKPASPKPKPVTKAVRIAKADPLAPLPEKRSAKTSKDSAPAR